MKRPRLRQELPFTIRLISLFLYKSIEFDYRLINGKLIVEEREAEVVQSIFAQYLSGVNPDQIAKQLMQIDTSGKVWSRHTVEYILKNEKYMGDALLQKQYTTETLPRQKKNNYGERDMFYIENFNPAIISREVYQKATELREQRRGKCSFTAREHLLAGIATCEQCGCLMRVKKKGDQDYLICRTHNEDSESCPITQIPVVTIYESFLRLFFNLSRHGTDILAEMIRNLHTIRNRQMLWHPDVVELNKRISDISNQIHTLTLLNKQGIVESDYFISKNNQLAEQLRKAKQQKEKLLDREDDEIIKQTKILLEVLEDSPEDMDVLDEPEKYLLVEGTWSIDVVFEDVITEELELITETLASRAAYGWDMQGNDVYQDTMITSFILRPMSASIICDLEDVAPDFLTTGDRCVYVIMKDGGQVAFYGDNASSGIQNLQPESTIDLNQVVSVLMPDGTELIVPES